MDKLLGNCSLDALRQRRSWKWRAYPADVLPAFVAEMDFDLAAPVVAAVTEAMAHGDCGYAHGGGLGEAFAGFAAERWGWEPDPALVSPVPDVMTGLAEVVEAITPPGSSLVINTPVYPPFRFRFGFYGRNVIEAPLTRDSSGDYHLDPGAIDAALSRPGTAAYLLCSPHNPTGTVWTAAELEMVADLCHRYRVTVLVDEIHAPLVLPGREFTPFLSLAHPASRRGFVFTSATKAWNIAGLKCGIAIAGAPEGAAVLSGRAEAVLSGHLGVLASVAAFTEGVAWLDTVRAQVAENRHLLAGLLAAQLPRVRYSPPDAGFLAWLDCRGLGLGDDPAAVFLAEGKVALTPGPDFGHEGNGFARLNVGTSPGLMAEAVHRMATAAVA